VTQLLLDYETTQQRRQSGQSAALSAAGDDWKAEATPLQDGLDGAEAAAKAQSEWFHKQVRNVLKSMPHEFAIEELRAACQALGIKPTTHKTWGGMANSLRADGLIEFAYERRAKSRQTHGKRVIVYRRLA
jgi:hypothetical protein